MSDWSFFKSALRSISLRVEPLPDGGGERKAHMLLLVVFTVACFLPFAGKAFNIDDPLFIWTAENIQANPFDPYGFDVNWHEEEMKMSDVNKNPPLVSYYIALVGSVFGWNETTLHIAFIPVAIAVVIGTYLIAGYYCANPLLAGLAALFTPVFLISGTTVMTDMLMLAFWVFAVYFWMSGLKKNSNALLLLSVVLMSLSALTKYFGMALVPLLLLYSIHNRRNLGRQLGFMLLPVAVLAGYQWATADLYGQGLLMDAASYAVTAQSVFGKISLLKALIGLSFTGGCVIIVLFFTHLIWSRTVLLIGLVLTAVIAASVALAGSLGYYRLPGEDAALWLFALEFGIFVIGGISLLAIAVLDFMHRKDSDSGLLFLWFAGTFLFAAFFNWTTAGRSILPIVPVAGILITRRIEDKQKIGLIGMRQILAPLLGAAVVAIVVTAADVRLANSARAASQTIHDKYMDGKVKVWFSGHWGFQYYMQRFGARPLNMNQLSFSAKDIFIVPSNNANMVYLPSELVNLLGVLEVPSSDWIATMNLAAGAGFYSDMAGPVPFVFGNLPSEKYYIYELKTF